jgi:RNA polymerase sigma-70 factor (ECF subfamily)
MLRRQYPRLTHAPLALQDEEMLSLLVERMLKALRQSRPATVRDFFALANQHLRWELNEFARQIDRRPSAAPLPDDVPATPPSEATTSAASLTQILEAIERLPDDLRESFSLVHVQGLTHAETAGVLAVSTKTIQRRLRLATAGLARELSGMAAGRGDEAFDPGGGAGP